MIKNGLVKILADNKPDNRNCYRIWEKITREIAKTVLKTNEDSFLNTVKYFSNYKRNIKEVKK